MTRCFVKIELNGNTLIDIDKSCQFLILLFYKEEFGDGCGTTLDILMDMGG